MEFRSGNIFIRDNGGWIAQGTRIDGGLHNFDHTTYFVDGTWRARKWRPIVDDDGSPVMGPDGKPQFVLVADVVKEKGTWLLIEAGCKHDFECLEGPGRFHCIYSHRDPQTKAVVQEANGWLDAYR